MAETAFLHRTSYKNEPKTAAERVSDVIYWILRAAVVFNIVVLFFPGFNPARISGMINSNLSLFSCGVSYNYLMFAQW